MSIIQRLLLNLHLSLKNYLSFFVQTLSVITNLFLFFFLIVHQHLLFCMSMSTCSCAASLNLVLLSFNQLSLRMHASFLLLLFTDRPPQHNECLFMYLLTITTSSLMAAPPPTFATDSWLSFYWSLHKTFTFVQRFLKTLGILCIFHFQATLFHPCTALTSHPFWQASHVPAACRRPWCCSLFPSA